LLAPFLDGYKALPHPTFGKSYQISSLQRWSDQSESMLQDGFDHVGWDLFRVASENNIDVYTDTVTEFIRKRIGDVVPTVTVKTYPNKKLPFYGLLTNCAILCVFFTSFVIYFEHNVAATVSYDRKQH
jgi:hypothetical protein